MAKMLDLDEVAAKAEKVLKISGKEYPMKHMSVEDFINFTREAEEQEKKSQEKELTLSEQMESLVKMVKNSFPTIPDEIVNVMPLHQLNAVIDFVSDKSIEESAEGSAEKK